MKIGEIRTAVQKHKKEELIYILLELYKRMPKAKKESFRLDDLISNPKKYKEDKKPQSQKINKRDLGDVEFDFNHFEEHSLNDNYFFPNREISKKERPKWRHYAKAFYKEIIVLSSEEENQEVCADMMKRLFKVVKSANVRSGDPFRSVGIEESVFVYQILALHDNWQDKREFIDMALEMAFDIYRPTNSLMEFLKTPDLKMLTIEKAKVLVKLKEIELKRKKRRSDYRIKDEINKLTTIVLYCYGDLLEWNDGILFFLQSYTAYEYEVKYYCLLRELFLLQQPNLIVQEMDKAKAKGVELRDRLWKTYDYIKQHEELPDYFS